LNKKVTIIISVLFLAIYIAPLNVRPMIIPDETRYAEMGREMVQTGDWIVPRLNGLRYFEKPPLGHWLNALSIKLLGENTFAVRLPGALSAGLSALMLILLIRRFTADVTLSLLAASVFLTSLEIFAIGTFCVMDNIFSMFLTAVMVFFFCAFMESRPSKRTAFLAGAGISAGLAFLSKGFLAFAIPAIVIVPFAIWQRKFGQLLRMLALPTLAAVLTALPWSIMIHLKEPDFWRYFFWVEHIDRFLKPDGGQHPKPFWFFIPVILVGTLPWTEHIIAAIYKIRRDSLTPLRLRPTPRREDPLVRFALCWFVFPFMFFSVSSGKLVTYILPCIAPLIVLFIAVLQRDWKIATTEKINRSIKSGVILITALAAGLLITQTLIPPAKIYRPNEIWKLFCALFALAVYVTVLLWAGATKDYIKKFFIIALGPLALMFVSQFAVPNALLNQKAPLKFIEQNKDKVSPQTLLISDNYMAPAVCWSYKRTDVSILDRTGEFTYGLSYPAPASAFAETSDEVSQKPPLLSFDRKTRGLEISGLAKQLAENSDRKEIVLITSTKRYIEYSQQLPKPDFESYGGEFVFARFAGKN
jgi:4-amino-4-deoxy-L-arabinose transferase